MVLQLVDKYKLLLPKYNFITIIIISLDGYFTNNFENDELYSILLGAVSK